MKYAVLVGDGMADYPLEELGGRTPLEVARIPNMDQVARRGGLGLVGTVPSGMPPGSDVAILSILGYDPRRYYTGRGPLEAARLGIEISPREVAFRCNLVTVDGGRLVDYSSGHIGSAEAAELIGLLQRELGTESVRFHPGVSYRHICIISDTALMHVACTPPHDVVGQPIEKNMPPGREAGLLRDLMSRSRHLLDGHEVNRARVGRGEMAANMIWLWGQGGTPQIPSFRERFGMGGGVISAVDLVKGIAGLIGLDSIEVPGATGYYDTDYAAKGRYAVNWLDRQGFVLVHVEAPDEAGHNGHLDQKIKAIESFDEHVVGPIMARFGGQRGFRVLVLPDHPTPIHLRTHTAEPVPFAWYGPGLSEGRAAAFSEREAAASDLSIEPGYRLMERFIAGEK
ncbi:MAG: cofactor-independent phosphoglycerate mutase [Chloroflexi bacterium]|nr:cofactor-independent phosphoglycerate mutase [Chloroflexota bacterium]